MGNDCTNQKQNNEKANSDPINNYANQRASRWKSTSLIVKKSKEK